MKKKTKIALFGLIPVFMAVAIIGLGFLIQFLWNKTISDIFAIKEITFWQALGLFLLGKLLTGSQFQWSNKANNSNKTEHRYQKNLNFTRKGLKLQQIDEDGNEISNEKEEKEGWKFHWWGATYSKKTDSKGKTSTEE